MDGGDDPLVGRVLDGRYEILERRAGGGMATVYRARDRRLGREVAVKIMDDDRTDDAVNAATFDREARAAALLHDAHIIGVFDQGEDRGRPFIVMEYVDGYTLRAVIAREAPMSPQRALAYIEPVAAALAVAHDAGLIHRDIKPENVLISSKGEVKVGDFGLARPVPTQAANATAVIVGTPAYVPPERAQRQSGDKRSDVYSTGVMLFEMLTGTKPYVGNRDEVAQQHVTRDVPAPSSIVGPTAIPHWLDELVIACTRRDPALRPADGDDLLHRIREARAALTAGTWESGELTRVMNPFCVSSAGTTPPSAPVAVPPVAPAPAPRTTVADTERTPRMLADVPVAPAPRPRVPSSVSRQRRRRRRRAVVLLILLLLVTGLVATSAWWLTSGRYTRVPDMTRQTQATALVLAQDAAITVDFTQDYSEDVPAGQIIATDPAAGSRVRKGAKVTASVSRGQERYQMPVVVGLPEVDATTALANAHLLKGALTQEYSDDVPAGRVLRASQEAGTPLKRDTVVDLVLSQGPEPIPVTNYTGQLADQAVAGFGQLGINVQRNDVASPEYSATCQATTTAVPAGQVISQEPSSGTLHRGDTVTLTVSQGPGTSKVPDNLQWSATDAAKKAVADAGLVPYIQNETSDVIRQNVVSAVTDQQNQPLAAGTTVPRCSTVVLHIV